MSDLEIQSAPLPVLWAEIAALACRSPSLMVNCPLCGQKSLSAAWNVLDLRSRETSVDMSCSGCNATENARIVLPEGALGFSPLERFPLVAKALENGLFSIATLVRQYAKRMPAAAFTTHSLWAEAKWSATTFRWHPSSEAPPIMGFVFENAEAGKEIFREAERQMNHSDRFEEIRVSIIEGSVQGQEHRPGYSVHICPDPEALNAHATAEDFVVNQSVVPFLGQWNRHYPIPGTPAMLPKFKQEFESHKEFLLAPAVRRQDGQLWLEPELGIIKSIIHFRHLSEITSDDPDVGALVLSQLITPLP